MYALFLVPTSFSLQPRPIRNSESLLRSLRFLRYSLSLTRRRRLRLLHRRGCSGGLVAAVVEVTFAYRTNTVSMLNHSLEVRKSTYLRDTYHPN